MKHGHLSLEHAQVITNLFIILVSILICKRYIYQGGSFYISVGWPQVSTEKVAMTISNNDDDDDDSNIVISLTVY